MMCLDNQKMISFCQKHNLTGSISSIGHQLPNIGTILLRLFNCLRCLWENAETVMSTKRFIFNTSLRFKFINEISNPLD